MPIISFKKIFFWINFLILKFYFFNPSFVLAQAATPASIDLEPINIGPTGRFIPDLNQEINASGSVGGVLEKVMSLLLGFFTLLGGLAFIIFFVLGAFSWLTAAGKSEQLKKARDQITNGLIGLIILVVSYTVFYILGKILGLNILSPAAELLKLKP